MTNCPNCGAVITGPICEYCDTRFDAWTLLPSPDAKVAKLLEDTPNILDILTPNEIREMAGLRPIKDISLATATSIRFHGL